MNLTYIFRAGRKSRYTSSDQYPTEFFYGFHEFKRKYLNVTFIEDQDLCIAPPHPKYSLFINKFSIFFCRIPLGMFSSILFSRRYLELHKLGTLIATTNAIGLVLSLLKRFGLIKNDIYFLVMGLLPLRPSYWTRIVYNFVLRNTFLVSISQGESRHLNRYLPSLNLSTIPFGVDCNFWTPSDIHSSSCSPPYVLAIGNDLSRDWSTLISSWDDDFPLLKIITSQDLNLNSNNIEHIRGDWRSSLLTDSEIRNLYRNALFVIVPLINTPQPSGQSCCLQAMACGKAVILTQTVGLWDPTEIMHLSNIFLVSPSDVSSLNNAVQTLLADEPLRKELGIAARESAIQHFSTQVMFRMFDNVLHSRSLS